MLNRHCAYSISTYREKERREEEKNYREKKSCCECMNVSYRTYAANVLPRGSWFCPDQKHGAISISLWPSKIEMMNWRLKMMNNDEIIRDNLHMKSVSIFFSSSFNTRIERTTERERDGDFFFLHTLASFSLRELPRTTGASQIT